MTSEEREQLASTERANERMLGEIKALSARIEDLEKAASPFAAIKPSSFYAQDGSENEGYSVVLYSGIVHRDWLSGNVDFTGKDLANLRAALKDRANG